MNTKYQYKLVSVSGGKRHQANTLSKWSDRGWEYVETKGRAYPKFVFRRPAPEPPPQQPAKTTGPSKTTPRYVYVMAAVFAALVVIGAIGSALDEEPERPAPATTEKRSPSVGYGGVLCEQAVRNQLASPSSADFERPTVINSTSTSLTLAAEFDAQNTFGATVRSSYTCRLSGTGDNLTVLNAQIHER